MNVICGKPLSHHGTQTLLPLLCRQVNANDTRLYAWVSQLINDPFEATGSFFRIWYTEDLGGQLKTTFRLYWRYLYTPEVWAFEFHQPVFKKVTKAGLNSLRQKEYQISVKKWNFWQSIPQKETGIGFLGVRDDLTIRLSKFFDKIRLSRSLRPLRLLRL